MGKELNDICFTSPVTGQQFTSREWAEYSRDNDMEQPVKTCDGFRYNIYGVCLNPHRIIVYMKKMYRIIVETASSNGRWNYGIIIQLNISGSGYGATYISNTQDGWATEKEAIYAGLCTCENSIKEKGYDVNNDMKTFLLKQVARCKDYYDPRQLNLFE